jgi:hypothetical protein
MKTKIIAGVALAILTTCANNSMAATAPAPDGNAKSQPGSNQSQQSVAVMVGILKSVLGNKQLTPMAVPEPSTLALAGLGSSLFLLARRQRK